MKTLSQPMIMLAEASYSQLAKDSLVALIFVDCISGNQTKVSDSHKEAAANLEPIFEYLNDDQSGLETVESSSFLYIALYE